jgi:hypothetical protein
LQSKIVFEKHERAEMPLIALTSTCYSNGLDNNRSKTDNGNIGIALPEENNEKERWVRGG